MIPNGHAVDEGVIPETHTQYKICDDFCCKKTPEEIKQIIHNIEKIGRNILIHASNEGRL